MTFVDAIKNGFINYANFKGRAGRAEFWYWTLFYVLVSVVVTAIERNSEIQTASNLVGLAFLIPNLAVSARRFRDAGVNPWLLLLQLVPVLILIWFIAQAVAVAIGSGTSDGDFSSALMMGDPTAWEAFVMSPEFSALILPLLAFVVSGIGISIFFLIVYLRPSMPSAQTGSAGFGDTTS